MKQVQTFMAAASLAILTAGAALAQDTTQDTTPDTTVDGSLCIEPARNGTQQQVLSEIGRFELFARLTDTPFSFESYDHLGYTFNRLTVADQTQAILTDNDNATVCTIATETFDKFKPAAP